MWNPLSKISVYNSISGKKEGKKRDGEYIFPVTLIFVSLWRLSLIYSSAFTVLHFQHSYIKNRKLLYAEMGFSLLRVHSFTSCSLPRYVSSFLLPLFDLMDYIFSYHYTNLFKHVGNNKSNLLLSNVENALEMLC